MPPPQHLRPVQKRRGIIVSRRKEGGACNAVRRRCRCRTKTLQVTMNNCMQPVFITQRRQEWETSIQLTPCRPNASALNSLLEQFHAFSSGIFEVQASPILKMKPSGERRKCEDRQSSNNHQPDLFDTIWCKGGKARDAEHEFRVQTPQQQYC